MSFEDKSLQCSSCGNTFTFSAEEQELFDAKGYTNEPKRCPPCREAKSGTVWLRQRKALAWYVSRSVCRVR